MSIRDLSLEMSLKPFTAHDGSDIDAVPGRMFAQWEPLIRQAGCEAVTVMLWTADGSEILDYRGDPEGDIACSTRPGRTSSPSRRSASARTKPSCAPASPAGCSSPGDIPCPIRHDRLLAWKPIEAKSGDNP